MTDAPEMPDDPQPHDPQPDDGDRLDRLVDRAVDRSATLEEWDALDAEAAADPTVWSWLGRAVRDDGLLRAVMAERVEVADRVELPTTEDVPAPKSERRPWGSTARPVLGWAAAVAFALLWWFDRAPEAFPAAPTAGPGLVDAAPLSPPTGAPAAMPVSASEDVLGELPVLLVSTTPLGDDGRTEVVYVRRTLERTIVDDVLEVAHDEYGLPEPVPVAAPVAFTESF